MNTRSSGSRDPITIAEGYSDLAEGAILALTELTTRDFEQRHGRIAGGELIVLGLGRLGGRSLGLSDVGGVTHWCTLTRRDPSSPMAVHQ